MKDRDNGANNDLVDYSNRNPENHMQQTDAENQNYESKLTENVFGANDEEAYRFLGEIKMTTSNPSQSMRSSCRSCDGGYGAGTGVSTNGGAQVNAVIGSGSRAIDMKMVGSSTPPSPGKS